MTSAHQRISKILEKHDLRQVARHYAEYECGWILLSYLLFFGLACLPDMTEELDKWDYRIKELTQLYLKKAFSFQASPQLIVIVAAIYRPIWVATLAVVTVGPLISLKSTDLEISRAAALRMAKLGNFASLLSFTLFPILIFQGVFLLCIYTGVVVYNLRKYPFLVFRRYIFVLEMGKVNGSPV